jgi:hypothetical protein
MRAPMPRVTSTAAVVAVIVLSACGGAATGAKPATTASPPSPAPPTPDIQATVQAAVSATVQAGASPSPSPTSATSAVSPTSVPVLTVYVGNTAGQGVYLRRSTASEDRLRAYPDGTPLTVFGSEVQNPEGVWLPVRAPDTIEGWVPKQYTTNTPPTPAPPPTAAPTRTPTVPPKPTSPPTATPPVPVPAPPTSVPQPAPRGCCRYCTTGQPCGNSCIAAHLTCRVGPGCACYGSAPGGLMSVQPALYDSYTPALLLSQLGGFAAGSTPACAGGRPS